MFGILGGGAIVTFRGFRDAGLPMDSLTLTNLPFDNLRNGNVAAGAHPYN